LEYLVVGITGYYQVNCGANIDHQSFFQKLKSHSPGIFRYRKRMMEKFYKKFSECKILRLKEIVIAFTPAKTRLLDSNATYLSLTKVHMPK